jgi:hypothetical protein
MNVHLRGQRHSGKENPPRPVQRTLDNLGLFEGNVRHERMRSNRIHLVKSQNSSESGLPALPAYHDRSII